MQTILHESVRKHVVVNISNVVLSGRGCREHLRVNLPGCTWTFRGPHAFTLAAGIFTTLWKEERGLVLNLCTIRDVNILSFKKWYG